MTRIYASELSTADPTCPGTHVLIVGVGAYPALIGGDTKLLLENPLGLKQLSSPPVSAKALADWFTKGSHKRGDSDAFHNPKAPLASVEMLLSPGQSYKGRDGVELHIEDATRANIARCFSRWKECSAENPANISVFYFCGHGVMGDNDYLLPSDFGVVNRENPWVDAIDITQTARAMRRLAGGPLYFFIDACRQATGDALSPGATPPALAYVDFKKPVKGFARLMLWATGEGQQAFGAAGKVSRFTKALLESLSGYLAQKSSDGKHWIITGSLLSRSVSEILEQENAALKPEKHQYVEQQLIGSLPFQFLSRDPQRAVVGLPASWTPGPEVRQELNSVKGLERMPDETREPVAEALEAKAKGKAVSVEDYFKVVLPAMLRWKGEEATRIHKRVEFYIADKPGTSLEGRPTKSNSWTVRFEPPVAHVVARDKERPDLLIRITADAMKSILKGDFDAKKEIAREAVTLWGDIKVLKTVGRVLSTP